MIFKKKTDKASQQQASVHNTLLQDIFIAREWISKALNHSGYRADFSLESLKEIDRFFDEQNKPGGLLNTNRGQRLFAVGSYIGEVLIGQAGGRWITDDSDTDGEINIAVRLDNGSICFPVQRAMKRALEGKEACIFDYACVILHECEKSSDT